MRILITDDLSLIESIKSDPFVVARIGDSPLHDEPMASNCFYLVGFLGSRPIGYCKCIMKAGIEIEVHPAVKEEFKFESVEFFHMCMEWIFDKFPVVERISTSVIDKFPIVRRYVEKRLGFTFEGTLRHAAIRESGYHDLHVLSILRGEYVGRR